MVVFNWHFVLFGRTVSRGRSRDTSLASLHGDEKLLTMAGSQAVLSRGVVSGCEVPVHLYAPGCTLDINQYRGRLAILCPLPSSNGAMTPVIFMMILWR
jgi:hypothetical protein